jgi:hypothetical protein
MSKAIPTAAAFLLLAAYGVAEGLWTDRWNTSRAAEIAAARLAGVPRTIGEWEGEDAELDPRVIALAELKGYVQRKYTHRETGSVVSVLLLCGRPGPISVHTPDVCFQGQGYVLTAPPQRRGVEAAGLRTEFWNGRFEHKGALVPESTTVFWSWSADGRWQAPDNPRLHFAREGALFKLYVIRSVVQAGDRPVGDPDLDAFMAAFLPAAQAALFPES